MSGRSKGKGKAMAMPKGKGPQSNYVGCFEDMSNPEKWSLAVYLTTWGDMYLWEITTVIDENYPFITEVIVNDNGKVSSWRETLMPSKNLLEPVVTDITE